jgi:hypothetical protein
MGLHRRQSLFDNFKDLRDRNTAVQVFWVVFELDRRWSFGTSLPFALDDRDIDPRLPEPGSEHTYLRAMIAFAKLCSRVWEALPPYGSSLQFIPKETEDYLDFISQNWLHSLPEELQFKHPRLGLTQRVQPRGLHRMRTMLYLRGNYVRLLIHRHHVLTPKNMSENKDNAQLVVDIAQDSIQVLVNLHQTSDIYLREQSIYHYYLLSAMAVVLLAVCHAPLQFADSCRASFLSAVALVKGFSRDSTASRRLWRSIRGLLPVFKSLNARLASDAHHNHKGARNTADVRTTPIPNLAPYSTTNPIEGDLWDANNTSYNLDFGDAGPDIFSMSNDLMDIYNLFGSATTNQSLQYDEPSPSMDIDGSSAWKTSQVTRHFQDLI